MHSINKTADDVFAGKILVHKGQPSQEYTFIIIFNTVAIVRANSHPLWTTKILVYLPLMAFMPDN